MIINTISTSGCQPQTIVIGRRGTYDTMQIAFDLSYLVESFGNGVAVLAVKRSQDESAYPAVTSQEDDLLLWTVSETDTYYVGAGECQLMWYVDGGLAKTIIYPMVVMRDILATSEEAPDAYQKWVDALIAEGAETLQNAQNAEQSASDAETAKDDAVAAKEAAEAAQQAAETAVTHYPKIENNYWMVWDSATQQYVSTGIQAEGEDGYSPEITITSIEGGHRVTITDKDHPQGQSFDVMDGQGGGGTSDYTDLTNKPSINNVMLTGNKTAADLGLATPSDIPTVPVQSVAGKTGAVTLAAGDVSFDDSTTYASGTVGAELSSQLNAISAKAPVIINTASGDIATFADGADGMPIKHLVASIEAAQEGSGDPSPSNVRPITGWTGLTGARTGENILDNTGIEVTANNLRIARTTGYGEPILLKGGVTYTFYSNSPIRPDGIYVIQPFTPTNIFDNTGSASITVTPTEDILVGINFYWSTSRPAEATALYCVAGSSIGSYEPYQGQTISVSWATEAGTVYGGTLDVVTGELTVDRALVTLNGTNYPTGIAATSAATATALVQVLVPDIALVNEYDGGKVISDYLPSTTDYTIYRNASPAVAIHYDTSAPNRRLWFRLPNITTEADAKTYLANNPLTVVYALATPHTYQLDPATVNTLLGNNTVYVDCGSVSVDYPADTGIVVKEQSNAISQKQDATSYVTLSGTIVTQTGADNTMYLCGELAELTFTAPQTGQTAIRFTSGTTPTVATFSGVTWLNGFDPTAIEASKTYEINILNGLGCAAWT